MKEQVEAHIIENDEIIYNDNYEEKDIGIFNESLEFKIDENYKYIPGNFTFKVLSNILYYIIALPILKIVTKIVYDLKIEGKENLKNIDSGYITVSNHVLVLDCAMVGIACAKRKVYFTTREESFEIPFVRKIIKYLNAIPIPKTTNNRKKFIKEINKLLKNKKIVHFYPEGELYPYCNKLRNFRNGAFDFAIKNTVPIIPIVYTFRDPKGIRKIFKKKKDVTMTILKPVSPNVDKTASKKVNKLKKEVFNKMENCIKRN